MARLAKMWGEPKRHKQIETYSLHLGDQGIALSWSVKSSDPYFQIGFVPPILARRFPPLLEGVVPASYDLPDDSAASGLQLADPSALVRAAGRLILLLEQAPLPLRPPMPRPPLERFHRELHGWDYAPVELAQAEREGLLGSPPGPDLPLTVPPPAPPLTDPDLARLEMTEQTVLSTGWTPRPHRRLKMAPSWTTSWPGGIACWASRCRAVGEQLAAYGQPTVSCVSAKA